MKLVRDIINRKKINLDTLNIIEKYINDKDVEQLARADDKKARKKVDQSVNKLKRALADYIRGEGFGLYGKSKVLKTTQDRLLTLGMEGELVNGIVKKIMVG